MSNVAQMNADGKPAHRLEVAYIGSKNWNPQPFFVVRYDGGRGCEIVSEQGYADVVPAIRAALEIDESLPVWVPDYWLYAWNVAQQMEALQ